MEDKKLRDKINIIRDAQKEITESINEIYNLNAEAKEDLKKKITDLIEIYVSNPNEQGILFEKISEL